MDSNLIYDVGFHNGDDTAYYLHRGYRVVAIEADPTLADLGRTRFADAIDRGRLILENVAVGREEGNATFWLSSHPAYNSFDRSNAEKFGQVAHPVEVRCVPFRTILAAYGPAYYVKLDVEGADRACLESMHQAGLPPYISFEISDESDLLAAKALGYSQFKLVNQLDHTQIDPIPSFFSRLRWAFFRCLRRQQLAHPMLGKVVGLGHWDAPRHLSWRVRLGDRWCFPFGSSGPFGKGTHGPWRSYQEVAATWQSLREGHAATGKVDAWKGCPAKPWFDVHCALAR